MIKVWIRLYNLILAIIPNEYTAKSLNIVTFPNLQIPWHRRIKFLFPQPTLSLRQAIWVLILAPSCQTGCFSPSLGRTPPLPGAQKAYLDRAKQDTLSWPLWPQPLTREWPPVLSSIQNQEPRCGLSSFKLKDLGAGVSPQRRVQRGGWKGVGLLGEDSSSASLSAFWFKVRWGKNREGWSLVLKDIQELSSGTWRTLGGDMLNISARMLVSWFPLMTERFPWWAHSSSLFLPA